MKKEITVGQLVGVTVTIIIALVTGWMTMSNKVSSQQEQINALKDRAAHQERYLERIESKIDRVIELQTTRKK